MRIPRDRILGGAGSTATGWVLILSRGRALVESLLRESRRPRHDSRANAPGRARCTAFDQLLKVRVISVTLPALSRTLTRIVPLMPLIFLERTSV